MSDRTTIHAVVGNDHTEIYALPDGIVVDIDVLIPTQQGPHLAARYDPPSNGE